MHFHFRLTDHLNHMFGVEVEPPPWDKTKRYTPDSINVRTQEFVYSAILHCTGTYDVSLGVWVSFSAIFAKGDNYYDFLFVSVVKSFRIGWSPGSSVG